ncbi:MAG: hypothetical protein WC635_11915 [Bacteriovorax sp.]
MNHLLILLLALVACQVQAMDLKDYLALPANPMKIGVTLDTEKVTKKIVAKTGGTLTLTATNGDTFELTIPPKSLQADTEITLQKVKSVKHPKLSAAAHYSSVEISPDGIKLQVPATLIFKPKSAYPIHSLTPFSAQADGDETHLAMLVGKQAPNEIKLALLHFSNYTISDEATAEEIIDQGLSQMEGTRISNWLSRKILHSNRTMGDIAKDMEQFFRETFNNVVLPSILRVNTCASGRNALENFLAWHRQAELLGADPESYYPTGFKVDLGTMMTDTSEQCYEIAKKACYTDHRPVEVFDYALQFMRMGELLGAPLIVERFRNLATKCSKFKFFMESEIWAGETRDNSSGVTAKAEFDFSLNPLTTEPVEGSIDIEDTSLNFTDLNCDRTSLHTKPSKVLIKNFLWPVVSDENKFIVGIGGLTPYSQAKYHCVDKTDPEMVIDMDLPPTPMGSFWGGMFIGTHGPTGLNELDTNTGFFNILGWQVRHDTKYATREYTQTVEGLLNETTTMIIYHTPEKL